MYMSVSMMMFYTFGLNWIRLLRTGGMYIHILYERFFSWKSSCMTCIYAAQKEKEKKRKNFIKETSILVFNKFLSLWFILNKTWPLLWIDLMHWCHLHNNQSRRHVGGQVYHCAACTCCAERALAPSRCAGPGQPGGMACRGWPAGCMLGDGARDSASFDPQQAGAPFCFDGVTSYMYKGLLNLSSRITGMYKKYNVDDCDDDDYDDCTVVLSV